MSSCLHLVYIAAASPSKQQLWLWGAIRHNKQYLFQVQLLPFVDEYSPMYSSGKLVNGELMAKAKIVTWILVQHC